MTHGKAKLVATLSTTMKPSRLNLLVCLWLAIAGNLALWRALYALPEITGVRGVFFVLAFALMIGAALYALLSLFAWPRLYKIAASFALLSAAGGTHFMLTYGVILDTDRKSVV